MYFIYVVGCPMLKSHKVIYEVVLLFFFRKFQALTGNRATLSVHILIQLQNAAGLKLVYNNCFHRLKREFWKK